jgi:Protein of unknown function (DUF2442)
MSRVASVKPLPGFHIEVHFQDGTSGELDLSGRLFGPVFEPLAHDPELFRKVFVDEFGAVCWPNGADLAPDALYREVRGVEVHSR